MKRSALGGKLADTSEIGAKQRKKRQLLAVLFLIMITALLYLLLPIWRPAISVYFRPPQQDQQQMLFQGVYYSRSTRSEPRPLMIHMMVVQLTTPGLSLFVTPGDPANELELPAQTTTAFLKEYDLQLAVNASFFEPFHAAHYWSYYPHTNDPVDIKGLAISNGEIYSENVDHMPVFCVGRVRVYIQQGGCPPATTHALSGNNMMVEDGEPQGGYNTELHPRTAIGTDDSGEWLIVVVVDGRQPGYSEGMNVAEVEQIFLEWGATQVLNLDGGGSTTLAVADGWGAKLLNSPIHTGVPMRQRPVGNLLGR